MRLVTMLCFFLASVSTWAGTFVDDFNDGDWDGWTAVATLVWDTDVADIVSIDDGILRSVQIQDFRGDKQIWLKNFILQRGLTRSQTSETIPTR